MNNNVLCLFDNLLDEASYLTATSEVASMPVSFLQNPLRTVPWRSTAGIVQAINITLPENLTGGFYSHFAFIDHNFPPWVQVSVAGWNDALDGNDLAFNVSFSVSDFNGGFYPKLGSIYNGGVADGYLQPAFILDTGIVTQARYIRVTLFGGNVQYFQLGRIVIAKAWQPIDNMDWAWELGLNDNSRWDESGYGVKFGEILPANTTVNLQLSWLKAAEQDEIALRRLQLGYRIPFVLQLRPAGATEKWYMSYYGRFTSISLSPNRPGNSVSRWRFEELL